jgi:hypothetical protein
MNSTELPHLDDPASAAQPPGKPPLLERLLSQESLQKMMSAGGGLLVLGFVIWLWKIGLFANPLIVATIVGAATLGTMLAGVAMRKLTRYELAGNGLTMLGALALPLNLWLYNAQGLITLSDGGHLWIPAAICCGIYAVVSWVVRDSRFVYALTGGIVLTGMLFLADVSIAYFWYLLPQVTFLVSVGWICCFAEQQFPVDDSPFSRDRFGRAFHRSGITLLTGGFILLLGGQLVASVSAVFPVVDAPLIATLQSQKIWAAIILAGSTVGFTGQHVIHGRQGRYAVAAWVTAVWCCLTVVDTLGIRPTLNHLLIGTASLVTIWNLIAAVTARASADVPSENGTRLDQFVEASHIFSVLLTMAGVTHFFGQFLVQSDSILVNAGGWVLVAQLITTTFAAWSTSAVVKDCQTSRLAVVPSNALMCMGTLTAILAAATTTLAADWTDAVFVSIALMALPTFSAIGTRLAKPSDLQHRLRLIIRTAQPASLTILTCLAVNGGITFAHPHLTICILLLVAALNWYLAAGKQAAPNSWLGHTALSLSVWQGLVASGIDTSHALVAAPTTVGLFLLLIRSLIPESPTNTSEESPRRPEVTQNVLVLLGNGSGILLAMNRVIAEEPVTGLIAMLTFQLAGAAVAGLLTRQTQWRRTFRIASLGLVMTIIAVINGLVDMSWVRRAELVSILSGTALMAMGYIAWAREEDERDGMATMGLTCGSLLLSVPLAIGLVAERLADASTSAGWGLFHEAGVIIAGIILLGSGLLCRVRATTLAGTVLFAVHLGSLVTLIQWPEQLLNVSVLMMAGGGTFFGTAVLLSIYRDRLMMLPDRIREGQGMFGVLKWR